MYKALRANISVAELIEKASHIGDADAARTLMNLVMQFRKVCNHPELFERADVVAPFSFADYGCAASIAREGSLVALHYSTRSPIELSVPELFYVDSGFLWVPSEESPSGPDHGVILRQHDWLEQLQHPRPAASGNASRGIESITSCTFGLTPFCWIGPCS